MNRYRCLLILLYAIPAFGQSNEGELRITVTDPAGLGVESRVELISAANQLDRVRVTDPEGRLTAKRLPFGVYQVKVEHSGFGPQSSLVEVRSPLPLEYEVKLSVAVARANMIVNGHPTLIDPHRVGDINRIGSDSIENRPASLPGRSVIDLVNSEPGWFYEGNAVLHPRGSEYQTQFVVDGVPLTDNRSPGFAPEIEADEVQSLSVYTANFPAEFGRKLGGVIEIGTAKDNRTGWHGKVSGTGGSFKTGNGYAAAQYGWEKSFLGFSGNGGHTDWYENPVVPQNYTNAATTSGFSVHFERDLTDRDRIGLIVRHAETHFQVPNELIQQLAGQRQDRSNRETMAIFSYQRVISPDVLADVRAMFRQATDGFWSNPVSIPIIAAQQRGFREGYVKGTVAIHHKIHEWKVGGEGDFTHLHEAFSNTITDPTKFDPATPASFTFFGRGHDYEQSAFVQDSIRWGNWSLDAGLRWDHYQLLVNQHGVSPRLGIARYWERASTLFHLSYDRIFQTPAFENILLASSPQVVSLNASVLRLPVEPSRGNYYEVGFSKAFFNHFRLDANYFRRYANNFADDDLLLNTSVSFPISFRKAKIYGAEGKIDLPDWGRLSGFVSYSYQVGSAYLPATGGLFLGLDNISSSLGTGRFWNSQDQRHTLRTHYRYQMTKRAWVGAGAEYGSGLPVEFEGTLEDALDQYGQAVVNRVDFRRGRVRPQFSMDAAVGAELVKNDRFTLRLQGDVQNLNDRLNVIDFAGLFSGNAIAPPRSGALRLTADF